MIKKLLLTACLLLICSVGWSAELLIRAQANWKDSWAQAKIDAQTPDEKREYHARSKIGDIIVVKPDGWEWGSSEQPPQYIVIQLEGMPMSEAKKYEEPVEEDYSFMTDRGEYFDKRIIKSRKYKVDVSEVDDAKTKSKGKKKIKADKVQKFKDDKIKDKTK